MELQHLGHKQHPLVFVQELSIASKENARCFGCSKVVDGPSYCCYECKYFLHKNCAELELAPEINHSFHPQHPLVLLLKSTRGHLCDICREYIMGFHYRCDPCDFDLQVSCALLQSSIAEKFPNWLHEHPVIFIQNHKEEVMKDCNGCQKPLSGPIYHCLKCRDFNLHKKCAELPLELNHPTEINHSFHPQHPLILLPKSTRHQLCDICHRDILGFHYRCRPCNFNLHVSCASLQSSIAENFPNYLHEHPVIFIQNHKEEIINDCNGCQKPLSGPIYHCLECRDFNLHKECAELPLERNHPYHRIHPLTLLPNPPIHPEKCCCYLCKIEWEGFVYCCSLCKFELTLEDVFAAPTITDASHEHPWTLVSREMSFICDICGTEGDRNLYVCTACHFFVHKNCISLPRNIRITRHPHVISHSFYLQQNQLENWECRICYEQVDARYGSYSCFTTNCNYIVHVNCATDKEIWDGTVILKDKDEEDERSKEAPEESMNLITKVIEEDLEAIEIKHAYHDHNLMLTFSGEIKDDDNCDGCMRPLSTPFYSCEQCKFFLHKNCAELPRKKRHPFHKHLLTLTKGWNYEYDVLSCESCDRLHHGFSYECLEERCYFPIDVQCSLLSDTLKHPSHEHPLFIAHNYSGKCSGCLKEIDSLAYRCTKHCDFTLDLKCATLPLTAWYKYDRHPLTLTYFDNSDPCQHYCDLCENERDPNHWFYYCADCDNSLHSNCALGELPLVKIGRKYEHWRHPHPLTFVKNIWNCPPCKVCGELCNGQALECKESECNCSVHWRCHFEYR